MRPHQSITTWLFALLPQGTAAAREAARHLLQALLGESSCKLCDLARCLERNECARSNRQYLFRWLNRRAWDPPQIYAALMPLVHALTRPWKCVPVILDYSYLSDAYVLLQCSLPFQGRALPLLRLVRPGMGGTGGLSAMLDEALLWLEKHLPGARERYVLVGDRGFPSHLLLKRLQESGWRYVFRIDTTWRMEHPEFTGILGTALGQQLRPGMRSRWFAAARFGRPDQGKSGWCRSHVVWCWDGAHKEPWLLITSEGDVRTARQIYRKRAGIECEFRDIKEGRKTEPGVNKRAKVGTGVSWLMKWGSADRVARLLVWVAVREWRLACIWGVRQLSQWRSAVEIGGRLSWFSITRAWLRKHPEHAMDLFKPPPKAQTAIL